MITKYEIREICKVTGLKPYQQEKFYMETVILRLLYSETSDLIYKGGTSLFMFSHLPRFSDDLDFNVDGDINLTSIMKKVSRGMDVLGIHHNYRFLNENEISRSFWFSIEGPLYTTPVSRITVKIDLSYREKTIMPTIINTYNPVYSDLLPFDVISMDPEEILNEKVRAVITRNKARDLFDIYFLLKNYKLNLDKEIIKEKLGYYNLEFSLDEFKLSIEKKRYMWDQELNPILLVSLPNFNDVVTFVMEKAEKDLIR